MKPVIEAIYSKYDLTGMNLFFQQAQTGENLPYCVFHFVNSVPDYSFNEVTEEIEIQFSIFNTTASGAMSMGEILMALFDDCSLSVTGYEFGKMQRILTNLTKDDDVFQHIITYQVLIHKDL